MSQTLPKEHEALIKKIAAEKLGCPIGGEGLAAERLGGLTNFNYLVDLGVRKVVIRIPGDGTEDLVDRSLEGEMTMIAGETGVSISPLFYDMDTGIKVMPYLENIETLSIETMHDPENIRMVADLIRKLHESGRKVDFRFDVYEMIELYERLTRENSEIEWEGYDEFRAELFKYRDRMSDVDVVLCHCDTLPDNFLKEKDGSRLYLIDWEYGGMNDPLWDIADAIIENDFDREHRNMLQEAYFGRPATQDEDERISILIVLIDFVWAVWGLQRCYYDHSLDDYGPARYERARRNFVEFGL